MMITRWLALLCAALTLLPELSKGQGTQPNAPPKMGPGMSVTLTPPPQPAPIDPTLANYLRVTGVRILQQTGGNMVPVEYHLTPGSQKAISAFGVSLTAHYADGRTLTTTLWEDELEATYRSGTPGAKTTRTGAWGGPLVSGEPRAGRSLVRGDSAGAPLAYVDGQVTAIVFFDRTSRGDSSIVHQIAAARKATSDQKAAFLKNVRAALQDPGVREAIGQRSPDVGDRFRKAFLEQPQPSDDNGESANRASELNYLAKMLAGSQAGFDYVMADRQAVQALFAEHSVIKEGE